MLLKPTEKEFTKTIENIGTFTFRYPTLRDELKAANATAVLLADNNAPSIAAHNIATMIGALSTAIVQAPAGFDLSEIYVYEELEAVYNAFIEQVLTFRGQSTFRKPPGS